MTEHIQAKSIMGSYLYSIPLSSNRVAIFNAYFFR